VNWHKVADVDELAEGGLKRVVANGKTLVLAHSQGRYSALDGQCPHAGGPLAEGSIENGVLVCPWHGREFELSTGQCEAFGVSIGTYPVEVRADGIFIAA
jgi:pyruvate oxidase